MTVNDLRFITYTLPLPDSDIGAADRRHVLWVYPFDVPATGDIRNPRIDKNDPGPLWGYRRKRRAKRVELPKKVRFLKKALRKEIPEVPGQDESIDVPELLTLRQEVSLMRNLLKKEKTRLEAKREEDLKSQLVAALEREIDFVLDQISTAREVMAEIDDYVMRAQDDDLLLFLF